MRGDRVYTKILTTFLLPCICVSMMSFLSFSMDVKKTMPRIATTMIAMLTQINLRLSIASMLPTTGTLSWLEFTLLSGVFFMMLNLIGHIICFGMDDSGHKKILTVLDKIFFGHTLCIAGIIPIIRIFSEGCHLEDRLSVPFTASLLGLLIVCYLVQLPDYRQLLREASVLKAILHKSMQGQLRRFCINRRGDEADSDETEKRMNEDIIDVFVPFDEPGQAAGGKHLATPCASEQRAASPNGSFTPCLLLGNRLPSSKASQAAAKEDVVQAIEKS